MTPHAIEMQAEVRKLKATGLSYREIAEVMAGRGKKMTRQMLAYYGQPLPGEHVCASCLQPLKKAK